MGAGVSHGHAVRRDGGPETSMAIEHREAPIYTLGTAADLEHLAIAST